MRPIETNDYILIARDRRYIDSRGPSTRGIRKVRSESLSNEFRHLLFLELFSTGINFY